VGATSLVGMGILATSAVSVAGAMPLVESTTQSSVPPITTMTLDEVKGLSASIEMTEAPESAAATPTPASPPDVERAPAPAPQPVAPAVSVSAALPDSPDSPGSPDSPD